MIRVIEANKDFYDQDTTAEDHDWCVQCMLYIVLDLEDVAQPVWVPGDQKRWPENAMAFRVNLPYDQAGKFLKGVCRKEVPTLNADIAKRWLDECENDHGHLCQTVAQDMPLGFLVIDTEDMCLVDLPPDGEFVALSYTWKSLSTNEQLQLTCDNEAVLRRPGGLSPDDFPLVAKDAAVLCKSLGRRFLWIDRLCIVQDVVDRKKTQIQAMDRVYQAAVLTIVAAADSAVGIGLPGVNKARRSSIWCQPALGGEARMVEKDFRRTITASTWNTRGWTFQERLLSKRCLYVADDAFYFTCHQAAYQESLGQILRFGSKEETIFDSEDLDSVGIINNAAGYLRCCQHYSQRDLKFDSDVLDAFQGVSNVLGRQLDSLFFWGVPEKYLVSSMLWTPQHNVTRRLTRPDIPTWAWAAWKGPILYSDLIERQEDEAELTGTLVRFHTLREDGTLRRIPVEELWFGKRVSFDSMNDAVYVLEQTSELVWGAPNQKSWPGARESRQAWSRCPQNPYTVVGQQIRSPLCTITSEMRCRALVFRTTTALLHVYQQRSVGPELRAARPKLYSHGERCIGSLMPMTAAHFWNGDEVNGTHEFAVLCSGIEKQRARKMMKFAANAVVNTKYFARETPVDQEQTGLERAWKLHLMLIKRDKHDSRLCRRVAIAVVVADDWRHCAPVWKDIILI